MNAKVLVPSDDGTRTIGVIKRGVFVKSNFHSKKHLCFKYDAIGIDNEAFRGYIAPTADIIKCEDRDTGTTYTIRTPDFQAVAIADDLGWGSQLFVPLRYWETRNSNYQLSLWGGEA